MGGWVYIVTNQKNGTLYIGVTSDLSRRSYEHRYGLVDGFSKRYGLSQLVWVERHETIQDAIRREKALKDWDRAWKIALIEKENPDWDDLYENLNA